jgi:hypothetical protein
MSSPEKTRILCAWPWVSGFFAAPAFVHLVRVLAGWPVRIGSTDIPMSVSWIGMVVCATLSIGCALIGCVWKANK